MIRANLYGYNDAYIHFKQAEAKSDAVKGSGERNKGSN